MSTPSSSDLTRAKRQRDSALAQARDAKQMVRKALSDLVPARKQVNSGFKEWKSLHPLLTRKKLLGKNKGKSVRRALIALFLPEISKAYMACWKRAPKAVKVINNIVDELQTVDSDLGTAIAKLEAINIPSSTTNVAALAALPPQVEAARNQALTVVDKATAMLSKCSAYKKKSMPFLKATDRLLGKVQRLATARLGKLKSRKLVLFAKKKRIGGYKQLSKKTARFQKKLGRGIKQVNDFVNGCPKDRRKLISARGDISAIMLPGMSPAPAPPVAGGSPNRISGAMSPREAVVAQLYAQSPHLHDTHYLG